MQTRCRQLLSAGRKRLSSTAASSPSPSPYDATLDHLRIGRHTRVIFQGFTGRQATANARESLAWGTNVVGGVTPGRSGEHLGLPLLPSVAAAVTALRPHATGIYVPAALAPAAIEEAIAAEVPLVVAVAEHIPLHAMLRISAVLRTQTASRLVGANSPGIIAAVGRCRIGFQPLSCFEAGRVGIAARSGTLSYEAVASTTRAGLGQSLCIGVGGDVVPGTDLREALTILATDPDTDAIALIGEIGGTSELEAAAWIREYHIREPNPKPIVALVAGTNCVPGRMMGHAGAFSLPGEPDAHEKIRALQIAGATIVDHPEKFGEAIKARLQEIVNSSSSSSASSLFGQRSTTQHRGLHTAARGRRLGDDQKRVSLGRTASVGTQQRRSIYLAQDASFDLLRKHGVNAAEYSGHGVRRYLAITVDRSARSPCVLAAPDFDCDRSTVALKRFPFAYGPSGIDGLLVERVAAHLGLSLHAGSVEALRDLLRALYDVFVGQEAFLVETAVVQRLAQLKVVGARLGLDDAGVGAREATATTTIAEPDEAAAKENGIVYIKLGQSDAAEPAHIATLVNGAGLAMNTVDALAGLGGRATNFLDTGGKATSETVRVCFDVLLRDPRVRVILVNVFGGLTLGDMIARGVLLAFRETCVTVPVVVRIRGTNEAEGQCIIRESGLPLFAFDSFQEAAAKAVELAGTTDGKKNDKRLNEAGE
ncbi:succinyl-synthetase subunit [Grosmannia clavigera kw1407]|uniref:Succinyl-synthetase subunit n=1 Tax=Grosmannia clavigera (strain kw1407 / UAMH 11150) TaxID=655863 RepID=F0X9B4_GROCL|nr:succinyl-synthetase subunit [Grosmannia clavigera kw1407]EFX05868.1 succinyl-synthetase subunit [Grosmannia clavigera kw1407]